MQGTVTAINTQRGMIAVRTDGHGYSIFELLGADELHIGDVLQWEPDTATSSVRVRNLTQGAWVDLYGQNHWVHEDQVRQQLLYV